MKARKYLLPGLIGLSILVVVILLLPRQKAVTILLEGQPIEITTSARTVADALAEAGFPLQEYDEVSPSGNTRLKDGDSISINPASNITIWADGSAHSIRTAQRIPSIWLAQAGLELGPADQLRVNGEPAPPELPLPFTPEITVELQRAVLVTLQSGGQTWVFQSAAANLGKALWDEGFRLSASDVLTPSPSTPLTGDLTASLVPGRQIQITADGQTFSTATSAQTIGEALIQAGLPLQGLDYSVPDSSEPIPADGLISVVRVQEEVVIEQETIPFNNLFNQPLPEVEIDNYQVVQIGQVGIQAKRVRVRTENGKEVSQILEDQWVLREPQDRIEGYGTKIVERTIDTPDGPITYWRKVRMLATSYSPCGDPNDRCYPGTSLGLPVQKGVVAVIYDWFIPMGNHTMYVPGYGHAIIADVGAGIPGEHWIDLAYSDEEYIPWYQYVDVYFTTPIPPEYEILYILPYKNFE
jgi:uncharacterized protein YabE (DUF348 family)